MSDNVTRPAEFERGRGSVGSQQRRREIQIARLREIEGAIGRPSIGKKGYVLRKPTDRIAAAREVGALVDEARRIKNVPVAKIKDAMPGTARLDRYKIEPGVSDAEARAKAAKASGLLTSVKGYLAAAEAVAALTGWAPDDLKIRVLSVTSLWSSPSALQTDEDPRASHLTIELKEMAKAVSRRRELKKIFERARRIPGQWEPELETFARSKSAALHHGGYLDSFEHWTEAPPLPSIPLIRSAHSIYVTALRLEDHGHPHLLNPNRARQSNFSATEIGGWFELSREIRLALGPLTSAQEIGPMFESRACVTLWFGDGTDDESSYLPHKVFPSVTLKPVDDHLHHIPVSVFQVEINGRWHRVETVGSLDDAECRVFKPGDDPKMWSGNPFDPQGLGIEHWYFSWNPINAESFAAWFDQPLSESNTIVVIREDSTETNSAIWYTNGSVAYEIERALASGKLERSLEEAVVRLSDALASREANWRQEASLIHAERMAAWRSPNNAAMEDENDH